MKAGKAPGPSGIVVEVIRAAGVTGASMICDLAARSSVMARYPPTGSRVSWSVSTRVRGRGALERGNYRGLKLTEQVMNVLERIVDVLIR